MTVGYGRESGVTKVAGSVMLYRSPRETSRPATLWEAKCPCGWSNQWGSRRRVVEKAREHVLANPCGKARAND